MLIIDDDKSVIRRLSKLNAAMSMTFNNKMIVYERIRDEWISEIKLPYIVHI